MMQTLLTQATSAPANKQDKVPLSGAVEGRLTDDGHLAENKGDFASFIARVKRDESVQAQANAKDGDDAQAVGDARIAKSLARDEAGKTEPEPEEESEALAPDDFLLRLQDSLKLDTTLNSEVLPSAPGFITPSEAVADGKRLPPEEGADGEASLDDHAQAGRGPSAHQIASQSAEGSSLAKQINDDPAALSDNPNSDEQTALRLAAGKRQAAAVIVGDDGSSPGAARSAVAAEAAATAASDTEEQQRQPDSAQQGAQSSKGGAAQPATTLTPGASLHAFNEGLRSADPASQPAPAAGRTESQQGAAGEGDPPLAAPRERGAATTEQATPVTSQPQSSASEPVLMAPQQILAQSESQGPQAPLSTLSAGIKQMEVSDDVEPHKAEPIEVKLKAGSEKIGVASEAATEQSQSQSQQVQHNQSSAPQVSSAESKSAAVTEGAMRRDPQSLPHLKLAHPEAPAELHQKVNLMLADKVQQAEIQLDPIGLGKMKIQIQIDAANQANVHFVVQHGQTREMLEQAMPRLREMLAGQGIQLGQTHVQHQSQQQGQSTFAGEGQQGQNGGHGHAGNGHLEGESTPAHLHARGGSAHGSGIDFYA